MNVLGLCTEFAGAMHCICYGGRQRMCWSGTVNVFAGFGGGGGVGGERVGELERVWGGGAGGTDECAWGQEVNGI